MNETCWHAALDEFAARLAGQRAALEDGNPDDVPPFAPPPTIGPIPDELRERARNLLQEAIELQAEMSTHLAAANREIQVVRRFMGATASPTGTTYVDDSL